MDLSTRTVRELIVELTHIEDALRGSLPVTLPVDLRARVEARQEAICAELRRRSEQSTDPPSLAGPVTEGSAPLLPEPA